MGYMFPHFVASVNKYVVMVKVIAIPFRPILYTGNAVFTTYTITSHNILQ